MSQIINPKPFACTQLSLWRVLDSMLSLDFLGFDFIGIQQSASRIKIISIRLT
jgi:hypothetical protein